MPEENTNRPQLTIQPSEARWDEVYQRISWWDADAIAKAWVLVVGAGALGNEALKNLALLGVGHIVLLDFDEVEYSNLSRSVLFRENDCGRSKAEVAAERVREINPNVEIIPLHGDIIYDLGLGLIRRMNVVIGCLDNRIARLYINRHCYKADKIWIDGGIENLAGRMDVFIPGTTCYECQLSEREWDVIHQRMSCTDVAQRNANFGRIATTPISSSIIAAMQVQEAMKVIFGNHDKLLRGKRFFMEGMSNEIMFYNSYRLKELCQSHTTFDNVISLPLSHQDSLHKTLETIAERLQEEHVTIVLDYSVSLYAITRQSEKEIALIMPQFRMSNAFIEQYELIPGEGIVNPPGSMISRLDHQFVAPEMTLQDLGIPALQILTIETAAGGTYYVELSSDLALSFPTLEKEIENTIL